MQGPELRGKIITLKPRRATDEYAITYIRHFYDPEVTKLMGSHKTVPTLEQEINYLEESALDESSIHWAIHFEGNCVGSISIEDIDWMLRRCSIGIFIGEPRLWGKGLASDAAQCVLEHVFDEYPFDVIQSTYAEGNEGSKALLASKGFIEVGISSNSHFSGGEFRAFVLTELSRDDWEDYKSKHPA